MDLKTVFEWLSTIVISIGGAGVLILGLSKWFGKVFASKILESDKARYNQELETLKSKFNLEIETRKADLQKTNSLFFRHSEHQFDLYNSLWSSLCELEMIGDDLWAKANKEKLKAFSKQLALTKLAVNKSALLLEQQHFNELNQILEDFSNFEIGKMKLISLRNRQVHELMSIEDTEIESVINLNRHTKDEFHQKTRELILPFKQQIKGS